MSSLLVRALGLFTDHYHFTILYTVNLLLSEHYDTDFEHQNGWYLSTTMLLSAAFGQIIFGVLGDFYGRSRMMVISCSLLILGGALCAAVYTETLYLLILCRIVLGIGIGGEYPLAIASAFESVDESSSRSLGQQQLSNVLITLLLTLCGDLFASMTTFVLIESFIPDQAHYESDRIQTVYRMLYLIGILPSILVVRSRWKHRKMEPALFVMDRSEQRVYRAHFEDDAFSMRSKLRVIWKWYLKPLTAACLSWFAMDCIVYSQLICGSLILSKLKFVNIDQLSLQNMVRSVGLIPAYLIGVYAVYKVVSCRKWQIYGFMAMGILFFGIGLVVDDRDDVEGGTFYGFMTLYFFSLFVTHCSARITTFLLPVDLFPTNIRCSCCGMASGFGKVGAAAGALFYHSFSSWFSVKATFVAFAFCSFLAAMLTILCIPDREGDVQFVNRQFYLRLMDTAKSKNLSMAMQSTTTTPADTPPPQRWSAEFRQSVDRKVQDDLMYSQLQDPR